MLIRIFGSKRDAVAGQGRKLHNDKLRKASSSSDSIRMIKTRRMTEVWHVACMREIRNTHKILAENHEGKTLFVRSKCRWKHNINMDLTDTGQECELD